MTIVVVCDRVYYEKSEALWASLLKYWKGRVCILTINYSPEKKIHQFEYNHVKINYLKSYIPDWPSNRGFYVAVEGGDFLEYFHFHDNEIIVKIDADMILQRELNDKEIQKIHQVQNVGMSLTATPPQTLREEFWRLQPKSFAWVKNNFSGTWGSIPLYCCGVIVAKYKPYKKIHQAFIKNINVMSLCFGHHAASQWLLNYLVKNNVTDLGNEFHCGDWFLETNTKEIDKKLYVNENMVAFNHTKFDEKWY